MSDNERPRLQRSEKQLRETLRMLCHFVWNGKPKEGDHVWSIPPDNERDFDFILADAISELVELRAQLATAEQREAALVKERDGWNERFQESCKNSDKLMADVLALTAENQRLKEALTEYLRHDKQCRTGECCLNPMIARAALAKKEPSDAH